MVFLPVAQFGQMESGLKVILSILLNDKRFFSELNSI